MLPAQQKEERPKNRTFGHSRGQHSKNLDMFNIFAKPLIVDT